MHPHCVFCSQYLTKDVENRWSATGIKYGQLTDIIFESYSFVVVAGLGALEEGYVLLLPKEHFFCMGEMQVNDLSRLVAIKDCFKSLIQRVYGAAILVEHGMNSCNSAGGCIDHAHIHIVPSLVNFDTHFSAELTRQELSSLQELNVLYKNGISYLFFEDNNGIMSAYPIKRNLPSQYFRKIWARATGKPDKWDWSLFPEEILVARTITRLKGEISSNWQAFAKLEKL